MYKKTDEVALGVRAPLRCQGERVQVGIFNNFVSLVLVDVCVCWHVLRIAKEYTTCNPVPALFRIENLVQNTMRSFRPVLEIGPNHKFDMSDIFYKPTKNSCIY